MLTRLFRFKNVFENRYLLKDLCPRLQTIMLFFLADADADAEHIVVSENVSIEGLGGLLESIISGVTSDFGFTEVPPDELVFFSVVHLIEADKKTFDFRTSDGDLGRVPLGTDVFYFLQFS